MEDKNPVLSLIVCSRQPDVPDNLKSNIQDTIGVSYELIVIDNSQNDHSMFSAYNEGVRRATGQFLCFMHEDIWFHSSDWGVRCREHFRKHPDLGMIGLAGNQLMMKGRDWRICAYMVDNYIQRFQTLEKVPRTYSLHFHRNCSAKGSLKEVVAVDGMWMVIRADLFPPLRFDEDLFKSFHLYDTDISLQVQQHGYKVCICDDILIEHFSEGSFTQEYYDDLKKALEKWDYLLPLARGISDSEKTIQKRTELSDRYLPGVLRDMQIKQNLLQSRRKGIEKPLSQEELKLIKKSVLVFHHVFNKQAPSLKEAIAQIHQSDRDGWLTPGEKLMFLWKAFLYQKILTAPSIRIQKK
ncbi:MAG: glycosyltransferase family protein [Bacteroidales bacterium]|nr:glycosyltransferase family protein [Bacteroidales bacterium]